MRSDQGAPGQSECTPSGCKKYIKLLLTLDRSRLGVPVSYPLSGTYDLISGQPCASRSLQLTYYAGIGMLH